jgi:hypothetical protein
VLSAPAAWAFQKYLIRCSGQNDVVFGMASGAVGAIDLVLEFVGIDFAGLSGGSLGEESFGSFFIGTKGVRPAAITRLGTRVQGVSPGPVTENEATALG